MNRDANQGLHSIVVSEARIRALSNAVVPILLVSEAFWLVAVYVASLPFLVFAVWRFSVSTDPQSFLMSSIGIASSVFVLVYGWLLVRKQQRSAMTRYRVNGIVGSTLSVEFTDSAMLYDGMGKKASIPYSAISRVRRSFGWYFVFLKSDAGQFAVPVDLVHEKEKDFLHGR